MIQYYNYNKILYFNIILSHCEVYCARVVQYTAYKTHLQLYDILIDILT